METKKTYSNFKYVAIIALLPFLTILTNHMFKLDMKKLQITYKFSLWTHYFKYVVLKSISAFLYFYMLYNRKSFEENKIIKNISIVYAVCLLALFIYSSIYRRYEVVLDFAVMNIIFYFMIWFNYKNNSKHQDLI